MRTGETLTTRFVEALPASDREIVVWDRELPGFGLRVHPSGSKVYMVHKRSGGKSPARHHRPARGLVPGMPRGARPGESSRASRKAKRPRGRARRTAPPAVRQLPSWRNSTWPGTWRFDANQQLPDRAGTSSTSISCRNSGGSALGEITPEQVAALHYRLREKAITANQVIGLLSRLFHKAAKSGYAPPGGNPCRFIKKYPTRSCERFLSEQEFVRLGTVLDELEAKGKIATTAAAGLRLLMLTGCRRNEILDTALGRTSDLEHDEIRLRDAKTGARAVPRCRRPRGQVLTSLPRQPDNPWVISGDAGPAPA